MRILIFICALSMAVMSCEEDNDGTLSGTGIIEVNEATTFQYGTHVLEASDGTIIYALRNSRFVDLDNYIGQTVTIRGFRVAGYPVDGGPIYLEVVEVTTEN